MIIIDFNGVVIANVMAQKNEELTEDLLRHIILNTIRMYNVKFRAEYGQVVIACDGGSWRRDVFPQYKFKRREGRKESDMDWGAIFNTINKVRDELSENFHYKVVYVPGVEADDIVATLVEQTQEFGQHEDVMIVSADKDFAQLQKYSNVKQFSPYTKKLVVEKNPRQTLVEHIFKGDSSDGVPNVLSGDDTFVEGIRQSPITRKKIDYWLENIDNLESVMDQDTYRNYQRNKRMIDLSEIPETVTDKIINTF